MTGLLILSLISGCGTTEANINNQKELQKTKIASMQFASGTINGGWVQIAAAIAEKANIYFQGYPITASTGRAISNPYSVYKGEAQIGLSQGVFLAKALAGEEPYELAMDNLRGIASLESTALYFITDKTTKEDTLGELIKNEMRMHLGTLSETDASNIAMNYVFTEYGLTDYQEFQKAGSSIYLAEGNALFKAYLDNYFDLLIINESVSDNAIRELLSLRQSKILSLEPEIIQALVEKYDWNPMTIPMGTYPGQTQDVHTVGIKSVLFVRDDFPEEVAYYIAKAVYENKAYLETIQDAYKAVNVNDLPKYLTLPIHPGAEKYYKEIGLISERRF